jgi:hypothetical protein
MRGVVQKIPAQRLMITEGATPFKARKTRLSGTCHPVRLTGTCHDVPPCFLKRIWVNSRACRSTSRLLNGFGETDHKPRIEPR